MDFLDLPSILAKRRNTGRNLKQVAALVTLSAITDANNSSNDVAENASVGTAVGITAFATDPGHSVNYTLDNSSGGKFAINSSTGVVTVASALSYAQASSHSITVRATSSNDGQFRTAVFIIQVLSVTADLSVFPSGMFGAGVFAPGFFAGI